MRLSPPSSRPHHQGATVEPRESPGPLAARPRPPAQSPGGEGLCRRWERGRGLVPSTRRRPYLFLPTVSWSFTTMVSSAPGSRGAPFRSHSKPWRGGEGSQDQRPC